MSELLDRLAREGINPTSYRLDTIGGGAGQDDCLCLRRSGSTWDVSRLERGSHEILAFFATEADACEDLFARLDGDPASRSHLLAWFGERAKADAFVALLHDAGITPNHRDVSVTHSGSRHRIFVDGRDLAAATLLLRRHAGGASA